MIKHAVYEYIEDIYVEFDDLLNNKLNELVEQFAWQIKNKQQAEYYHQLRRAGKIKVLKKDLPLGKKAEFVAAYGLHQRFSLPLVSPDLKIYKKREKKWSCDLIYGRTGNVHVKGCDAKTLSYCDDFSWTFQYRNKNGHGGTDNIFKAPSDDFLVAVFMEDYTANKGIIKAIIPIERVKRLVRNPKNEWLIGIKQCLYYKDLFKEN